MQLIKEPNLELLLKQEEPAKLGLLRANSEIVLTRLDAGLETIKALSESAGPDLIVAPGAYLSNYMPEEQAGNYQHKTFREITEELKQISEEAQNTIITGFYNNTLHGENLAIVVDNGGLRGVYSQKTISPQAARIDREGTIVFDEVEGVRDYFIANIAGERKAFPVKVGEDVKGTINPQGKIVPAKFDFETALTSGELIPVEKLGYEVGEGSFIIYSSGSFVYNKPGETGISGVYKPSRNERGGPTLEKQAPASTGSVLPWKGAEITPFETYFLNL